MLSWMQTWLDASGFGLAEASRQVLIHKSTAQASFSRAPCPANAALHKAPHVALDYAPRTRTEGP
jgi:hypothetical protein